MPSQAPRLAAVSSLSRSLSLSLFLFSCFLPLLCCSSAWHLNSFINQNLVYWLSVGRFLSVSALSLSATVSCLFRLPFTTDFLCIILVVVVILSCVFLVAVAGRTCACSINKLLERVHIVQAGLLLQQL